MIKGFIYAKFLVLRHAATNGDKLLHCFTVNKPFGLTILRFIGKTMREYAV